MADDLDKKLKQIAEMFGVSDTEGLKNIVDNIMPQQSGMDKKNLVNGSSAKANANSAPSSPSGYETEIHQDFGNESSPEHDYDTKTNYNANRDYGSNLEVMSKAGEMMSMFNNIKDSRITLLNSVQPFLGPQRQQRIGGAIQLLKVINVLSSISPTINRTTKG